MKEFLKDTVCFIFNPLIIVIFCLFASIGILFSILYVNHKAHSSAMNYSECVSRHVDLTLYRGLTLDKKYDIIQKYKCKINSNIEG